MKIIHNHNSVPGVFGKRKIMEGADPLANGRNAIRILRDSFSRSYGRSRRSKCFDLKIKWSIAKFALLLCYAHFLATQLAQQVYWKRDRTDPRAHSCCMPGSNGYVLRAIVIWAGGLSIRRVIYP